MTPIGVILYGPPGAGKDTVTTELADLRPEYRLFERLKAGPGRTEGYRLTTSEHLAELEASGALLYSNARYGARYGIDHAGLSSLFDAGAIPVLHMGQIAGAESVERFPATWARVLLWCQRSTTAIRCEGRGDTDVSARLRVWDETRLDLLDHHGKSDWSLAIDTDHSSPKESAAQIDALLSSGEVRRSALPDAWLA